MTDTQITQPARRLADAVAALVDDRFGWLNGRCVRQDSIYTRLKDAMTGRTTGTGAAAAASRAPLRIDVLTLITEIDTTTARWNHTHQPAAEALRELATRTWTPDQTETVEDIADTIERWTTSAAQILNDAPPSVPLRLPCPACARL